MILVVHNKDFGSEQLELQKKYCGRATHYPLFKKICGSLVISMCILSNSKAADLAS